MKNLIFAFLGVFMLSNIVVGQSQMNVNGDGVAINGYDVVAYHTQNQAIRGSKAHSSNHDGAIFYFSSAKNLADFKAAKEKYLPKYGGYCAFGMAMGGGKVPTDPTTFKLYDGNLYLFFNDFYEGSPFNTIVPWNADEANLKVKAEASWKKM